MQYLSLDVRTEIALVNRRHREDALQEAWVALLSGRNPISAVVAHRRREMIHERVKASCPEKPQASPDSKNKSDFARQELCWIPEKHRGRVAGAAERSQALGADILQAVTDEWGRIRSESSDPDGLGSDDWVRRAWANAGGKGQKFFGRGRVFLDVRHSFHRAGPLSSVCPINPAR